MVSTGAGEAMTCSATALTPTVLLTAAHCVVAGAPVDEEGGGLRFVLVELGQGDPGARVDPEGLRPCPSWDRASSLSTCDLGLVRLAEPLELSSFPRLRRAPLGPRDLGTALTAVGYGRTGEDGSAGVKRSVPMRLATIAGAYFSIRHPEPEAWRGTCYGDSGGASLLPGPLRDVVYGVHSATLEGGCGTGIDASVPRYFESFVRRTVLELDPGAEACGDGLCTALEEAESCPDDCAPASCGDGVLDPDEVCDDGGNEAGDGCAPDCASDERCGNGVVDLDRGESCDDGDLVGGDGCDSTCRYEPTCGNGLVDVDAGEGCDDGNLVGGDGCSADCLVEGAGPWAPEPAPGCACRAARARQARWPAALLRLLGPGG